MSCVRYRLALVLAAAVPAVTQSVALAAPYASNVIKSGTTVNFILNEPADTLTYSINGGPAQALDGTTKGSKTFSLASPTDTFSISAQKSAAAGYTIPSGVEIPNGPSALSKPTPGATLNIISDDTNVLGRFNSPRGVSISKNPNAPNFGTAYISNSATGSVTENTTVTPALPARTLVDEGIYALRSDQSDAFGYGDNAKNPLATDGFPAFSTSSASSPYRTFVAGNGDVYVADYSDINGTVWKLDQALTASQIVLAGIGGPAPPDPPTNPDGTGLPEGQNHGSISSLHVEGALAGGDLVLYAIDEDINSAHFGGTVQGDRNSVWRWDIGSSIPTDGSTVTPTKIGGGLIGTFPAGGITVDFARGADGKFYLSQNRQAGAQVGIQVLDTTGAEIFNSLNKSREILNDPAAADIFTNVFAIAVSPDQKWLAAMLNIGDVAVVPLVDGIPDIANRMVVDTLPNTISGRDIDFDAAGNIHYVSSGQGIYRVLAPGGNTTATTTWNGTEYSFSVQTASAGLAGDFDDDNDVDGNDFLVWQRGGSPNPLSDGDLTTWKNNFGMVGSATAMAAAVPEPSAFLLGACVASVLAAMRTGRRRVAVV